MAEDEKVSIARLEGRMDSVEEYIREDKETKKQMQELTYAVKDLAVNMQYMIKQQQETDETIKAMQNEPNEDKRHGKRAFISSVVNMITAAVVTCIIYFIVNKPF